MTGEDDGIDHSKANLLVEDTVVDDMLNEGIAASQLNRLTVTNSLIMNCDQGIEAGWGRPEVIIDHCTVIYNRVGLRLGDSYDWGCQGTLTATNSIIIDSDNHNIWNYDIAIEGPRANAVNITYSIVNQDDYDNGVGCITGVPLFNPDFTLQAQSVGNEAASDHLNMGLLPF